MLQFKKEEALKASVWLYSIIQQLFQFSYEKQLRMALEWQWKEMGVIVMEDEVAGETVDT